MKKVVIFLLYTACAFTFLQCNKIENQGDGIIPIPIWDYSKIAFISRIPQSNNASWFLFTVDKTGDNKKQIVDMPTTCSKPVCSHSGNKLLFSTLTSDNQHELYVVNTDGSELTLIDSSPVYCGNADWSPDDAHIVYVRRSDPYWNNSELVLYNMPNKTHQVLQNKEAISCPKFSPNGKQIAYVKSNGMNQHIYKIDIKGNKNQLIISNAFCPNWAPQGGRITYLSLGVDGSPQIFIANCDGSGQKQLTSSVSPVWMDTGFPRDGNEDPQWTPDGKQIVYVSWENGKPEIFIMNADGTYQRRLTTAELRDENPTITPDGQYILFSSRKHDMIDGGICVMALDGSNQQIIYSRGIHPMPCK